MDAGGAAPCLPPLRASQTRTRNKMLDAMRALAGASIDPFLESVDLPRGAVLYPPGGEMTHVYFPVEGVISLVVDMPGGGRCEIAMVGREGLVGVPALVGVPTTEFLNVVQVEGRALRIASNRLREVVLSHPALREIVDRYYLVIFTIASYSAACNALHTALQRAAHWILAIQDRVGPDFGMTQDHLSVLLGVRRATMNEVLGELKSAGLIEGARGRVTVRDRAGLEKVSCGCYRMARQQRERVMPGSLD